MILTGLFVVLSCFVLGVPAPPGGGTRLCKRCDHYVRDPRECTTYDRCHEDSCVTEVHLINHEYKFLYTCKPKHECEGHHREELVGKRAPHHDHNLVCIDCCTLHNCQVHEENACSKYFSRTTTPAPQPTTTTVAMTTTTVRDNTCRDYETASFSCAHLDKVNFCTDTTNLAHIIAMENCAKHCGLCDASGTLPPINTQAPAATTMAPVVTTMAPAGTTMGPNTDMPADTTTMDLTTADPDFVTPMVAVVNATASGDTCVDVDDPSLTCSEMSSFGFCDPSSGAGYSFAKIRCRKTCSLC